MKIKKGTLLKRLQSGSSYVSVGKIYRVIYVTDDGDVIAVEDDYGDEYTTEEEYIEMGWWQIVPNKNIIGGKVL